MGLMNEWINQNQCADGWIQKYFYKELNAAANRGKK
jgi:hypothetical protein